MIGVGSRNPYAWNANFRVQFDELPMKIQRQHTKPKVKDCWVEGEFIVIHTEEGLTYWKNDGRNCKWNKDKTTPIKDVKLPPEAQALRDHVNGEY